jgi:hypothetical protein
MASPWPGTRGDRASGEADRAAPARRPGQARAAPVARPGIEGARGFGSHRRRRGGHGRGETAGSATGWASLVERSRPRPPPRAPGHGQRPVPVGWEGRSVAARRRGGWEARRPASPRSPVLDEEPGRGMAGRGGRPHGPRLTGIRPETSPHLGRWGGGPPLRMAKVPKASGRAALPFDRARVKTGPKRELRSTSGSIPGPPAGGRRPGRATGPLPGQVNPSRAGHPTRWRAGGRWYGLGAGGARPRAAGHGRDGVRRPAAPRPEADSQPRAPRAARRRPRRAGGGRAEASRTGRPWPSVAPRSGRPHRRPGRRRPGHRPRHAGGISRPAAGGAGRGRSGGAGPAPPVGRPGRPLPPGTPVVGEGNEDVAATDGEVRQPLDRTTRAGRVRW